MLPRVLVGSFEPRWVSSGRFDVGIPGDGSLGRWKVLYVFIDMVLRIEDGKRHGLGIMGLG